MLGNVVVMHNLRSHCHNRTLIVLLCILGNLHTKCESNKDPAYRLCTNFGSVSKDKSSLLYASYGLYVPLLGHAISRLMVAIACLHLPDVPRRCTMSCSSVGCMNQRTDPTSREFWACSRLLKELLYNVRALPFIVEPCDLNMSFVELNIYRENF